MGREGGREESERVTVAVTEGLPRNRESPRRSQPAGPGRVSGPRSDLEQGPQDKRVPTCQARPGRGGGGCGGLFGGTGPLCGGDGRPSWRVQRGQELGGPALQAKERLAAGMPLKTKSERGLWQGGCCRSGDRALAQVREGRAWTQLHRRAG